MRWTWPGANAGEGQDDVARSPWVRRAAACLAMLLAGLLARGARADPPAPRAAPPASATTPPRAIALPEAAYPPGASGGATVVVELLVDREGTVVERRVVDGHEPFATSALSAAAWWRFAPAVRAGHAVAARIRVAVDFAPRGVAGPAPRGSRPAMAPRAGDRPGVRPQEVLVRGTRPEPPKQTVEESEVRQLPGTFGDAFRVIEALPGVTPIVSGLPYFLVRGAPPGDTGFFVDGVRVPALFHLGVGAAVVHPDLIDRVDLYPGAYPARFGRFTGGILSGELTPFPDRPYAEASLRLIDAGALVTTPVDGGRGDVMVSGRYGYPGPLITAVAAVLAPSVHVSLAYWDYQVRGRYRVTDRDEVSAFVFGSYDALSEQGTSLGIEFHRADLRWDHATSATGRLRVALTLGYDKLSAIQTTTVTAPGGFGSEPSTTEATSAVAIRSGLFGLRSEWSDRIARDTEMRLGADVVLAPYDAAIPGLSPKGGLNLNGILGSGGMGADFGSGFRQTDLDMALYAEAAYRPAPAIELLPGLRTDVFTSRYPQTPNQIIDAQARATVDPRLTARWHVTPTIALVTAAGVAHQPSNIPLPFPGLSFSQLSRGLQTAYQYSEGVEVSLPWKLAGTATAFLHDYTGLADYYDDCGQPCSFDGRAYGLELLVRRKLTERITGWLSYTLSRSVRESFYGTYPEAPRLVWRLSEYDRTHVLNAIFAADLGKHWRAGLRVVAYSGLPYATYNAGDAPPDARGRPFVRVDVRIEKSWHALGGRMTFVFEWLNALLQRESISTSCQKVSATATAINCSPELLPVPITFPSIGLEQTWGK